MLTLILPLITFCEADCFYLNANGSTLFYAGRVSALANQSNEAFNTLQTQHCDSGILLKRTLKSVQLIETPEYNSTDSRQTETHYGYCYSVTHSKDHRSVYTLSRSELRANFETVEATEANSCRPAKPSDFPRRPKDGDGNDILG